MMSETAALHAPHSDVGQSSSFNHNHNNAPTTTRPSSQDARFSCNICFDAVTDPVVTRCGHLHCWPCLYRWLAPGMTPRERASLGMRPNRPSSEPLTEGRRVCPVCKSECSVSTVVPIYVRDDTTAPTQQQHQTEQQSHPSPLEQPQEPQQSPPVPVPLVVDHMSEDGNMGLDIDDDDDDMAVERALEPHAHDGSDPMIPRTITMSSPAEPLPQTTNGLRQRRRPQEEDDLNNSSAIAIVPTRPIPVRDRASTMETSISSGIIIPQQRTPSPTMSRNNTTGASNGATPNHHARATLCSGLVLALYQIFLNATNATNNGDNGNSNDPDAEAVPSLHYPQHPQQQRRDSSIMSGGANEDLDDDPAATIFLSRLLLGLSLFVLICLLSF